MKIAIAQKRPAKDGRRLVAFYNDKYLVLDRAIEELSSRSGLRVPAVVCFEKDETVSGWKCQLLTFDPERFERRTVSLEDHLHTWIDAGIRLAASDFIMRPMAGYRNVIELSLGRHEKPLYHVVWERWPIWQSDQHIAAMRQYTESAGAHEDLIRAYPKFGSRYSASQVKDACKRLKLPLRIAAQR
jgi:hypothetical protein